MFGLPSFESIVINVGKMINNGPLGAIISGANDIDKSATALATALGDQSPESIAARNRVKDLTDNHFEGEFHNSRIPESLYVAVRPISAVVTAGPPRRARSICAKVGDIQRDCSRTFADTRLRACAD